MSRPLDQQAVLASRNVNGEPMWGIQTPLGWAPYFTRSGAELGVRLWNLGMDLPLTYSKRNWPLWLGSEAA